MPKPLLARRCLKFAVLLLLVICLTDCLGEGELGRTGKLLPENIDCKPALRLVANRPFAARSGPMEIHALAVMAGCKSQLENVTSSQEAALVSEVFVPFVLEGGGVATSRSKQQLQNALVAKVNARLGGHIVSDVLVYRMSWKEYLPAD
jgi:hypothetical protein